MLKALIYQYFILEPFPLRILRGDLKTGVLNKKLSGNAHKTHKTKILTE
jgi:hypothetical protein